MNQQKAPRSDLPTMVLHWTIVAALILSLLTGLRMASDMTNATWAIALSSVLPQGNVILWHLWAAVALIGLTAAYIAFLLKAGLASRIKLDGAWLNALLKAPDARSRWRAINVAIYWLAFLMLIVAGATGVLLDVAPGLASFSLVVWIHKAAAWSIPAYIVIHVIALLALGGIQHLLKILRPTPAYGISAAIAVIAGGTAAAALVGLEQSVSNTLVVKKAGTLPALDGVADDPVWRNAQPVAITTVRGANSPEDGTVVTVRAVHDATHFYGLFQWPDSTRSQKHLPLVKTAEGWRVTQTEYGIQDEDSYYEDKFGVMLSTGDGIAGNHSIHLGNKPLDGKPGPSGGRGLHYTTDRSIVDVWHWKSVRTGNSVMNQIDDNYFGPPLEPKKGKRYTGGYSKDPKTGGGYTMNWKKYSDDLVTPKYLPKDPAALERFASVDLSPEQGDAMALMLKKSEVVPYDTALDTLEAYPVGTILPAVVVDRAMEGDRGDVTAVARWADGVWTMEVKRRLETGSEFDVAFTHDTPTYLWVAAFDHAQTRHSRHMHPVTVELQ